MNAVFVAPMLTAYSCSSNLQTWERFSELISIRFLVRLLTYYGCPVFDVAFVTIQNTGIICGVTKQFTQHSGISRIRMIVVALISVLTLSSEWFSGKRYRPRCHNSEAASCKCVDNRLPLCHPMFVVLRYDMGMQSVCHMFGYHNNSLDVMFGRMTEDCSGITFHLSDAKEDQWISKAMPALLSSIQSGDISL